MTMTYEATLIYIGTCYPDYLQDHHTREGECLLGVPVDGASTFGTMMGSVLDDVGELPDGLTDDMLDAAVAECFAGTDPAGLFDSSLETADGETPTAWFVLSWSEDEGA